ncbi:hypothetical protein EVAR_82007_1 [Eumeta japonica]|uniref:ATP-dependent DNA helicase n=1 Tax=Eumeta variegata TaxID=151549 RepID=A0A4C1VXJ7_EUMVA|nr:hypothetical protein EVAR_82007_1 [Eumeta japonica]
MAHKRAIEALDRTIKDIKGNQHIMRGMVVLLAGNFRQTLPVIKAPANKTRVKIKIKVSRYRGEDCMGSGKRRCARFLWDIKYHPKCTLGNNMKKLKKKLIKVKGENKHHAQQAAQKAIIESKRMQVLDRTDINKLQQRLCNLEDEIRAKKQ